MTKKTRAREASSATTPVIIGDDQVIEIFNETARRIGWIETQHLTRKVREQLVARIAECDGLRGWRDAMALVEQSKFLRTKLQPACRHLGWLVDQDHFTSLMHGRYNPEHDPLSPVEVGTAMAFARRANFGTEVPPHVTEPEPAPPPPPSQLAVNLCTIGRYANKSIAEMQALAEAWIQRLEAASIGPSTAREILSNAARMAPRSWSSLEWLEEHITRHVRKRQQP